MLAVFISSCEITQKREKRLLGTSFPAQKFLLFLHGSYAVEMGKVEEPVPYEGTESVEKDNFSRNFSCEVKSFLKHLLTRQH